MLRREFIASAASSATALASAFTPKSVAARNAESTLRSHDKACIAIWLTGGAPTSLLWDVKPKNRQQIKSIETDVPGIRISEHLPKTARLMKHVALVRSMSTRESEITRAAYFMRTCFSPNPAIKYPAFGATISKEVGASRPGLKLPGFVAIGGEPEGPGFLGNSHAAYVMHSDHNPKNTQLKTSDEQFQQRLKFLAALQEAASERNGNPVLKSYRSVQAKAAALLDAKKSRVFDISSERPQTRELYGDNEFGRRLIQARRLVEQAVPFVEVHFPISWRQERVERRPVSVRQMTATHMPMLDSGLSGLLTDLNRRGMLEDVNVVCLAAYSLSPRDLQSGRSPMPWSAAWSIAMAGGGLKTGQVVGATDEAGVVCITKSYLPGDIWATVAQTQGVDHLTKHRSPRGREVSIVNGGSPIADLI